MRRLSSPAARRIVLTLGWVTFASLPLRLAGAAGDVKTEIMVSDLKAPCGVAVRPVLGGETYEVFVADRGAGRILSASASKPGNVVDIVAGFPVSAATDGTARCSPGIQSLFFLDHARLVVTGGDKSGKPLLRLYDLAESEGLSKADEFKQGLELPANGEHGGQPDLTLCLHEMVRTQPNDRVADQLIIAAFTDRGSAGLWKVPVRANTLGDAAVFQSSKEGAETGAIGGIAIGSNGYVVTANGSESRSGKMSSLQYVNPIDGRRVLNIDVPLPQIVAIAYHPASHNLYAASFEGSDGIGGIYRVDDATKLATPAATVEKVAEVRRPTAMSFGPDGALFVTTLGGDTNKRAETGKLLKLIGEW